MVHHDPPMRSTRSRPTHPADVSALGNRYSIDASTDAGFGGGLPTAVMHEDKLGHHEMAATVATTIGTRRGLSFYWLIEGVLAGCSRPGQRTAAARAGGDTARRFGAPSTPDPLSEDLEGDLAWLRGQGIGAVLSLTETPLAEGALARHGLAELHLAVDDLRAPTPDQFTRALSFIDRQRALGRSVAVHCLMGQGRTGTVLAAYLIRGGVGVEEALRQVRRVCPGAVGSSEQERALHAFAARRDWIL